jgi:hypothetical protein
MVENLCGCHLYILWKKEIIYAHTVCHHTKKLFIPKPTRSEITLNGYIESPEGI